MSIKKTKKDQNPNTEVNEQTESLNDEMSDDELEGITGGVSWTKGTQDDDIMFGSGDDDKMVGMGGADTMIGGDGDDTMDGGYKDGANDVAIGGAGDDVFYWGVTGDGNDTFIGGEDNDTIKLDLHTVTETTIHEAWTNGTFEIELVDGNGNSVEVTSDMWNDDGELILPDDVSGVITGPGGAALAFSEVEKISTLK